MAQRVFLDTNVLVYAHAKGDLDKYRIAIELIRKLIDSQDPYISVQVVNEFYNAMAKKQILHNDIVKSMTEIITIFNVIPLDLSVTTKALTIRENYHYSWYDSLIIASALNIGCTTL